jgi:hypothetical protein
MIQANRYFDLRGHEIDASSLKDDERQLVDELHQYARQHSDARTAEFNNFYIQRIRDFYSKRGLSRREILQTVAWRIAQDLNGRLMIAAGLAKRGDYRDELETLILTKYKTRRQFCDATGLSEDMLSHVLAKRKDFGIQSLSDALAKIGYAIHITQLPEAMPPSK